MRAAPAVDAVLGDGRRERALAALAFGLGGAAVAGWLLSHAGLAFGVWLCLATVVAAVGAALAGGASWPAPPARLRWTGHDWRLAGGESLRAVSVQIDTGQWMLLRLRPQRGRPRWAGVSAAQAGSAWHGLRVALQFHAAERSAAPAGPAA